MRPSISLCLAIALLSGSASAQRTDTSGVSKTFFTKQDLITTGIGLGAAAALSVFDTRIARWSQQPSFQDGSKHDRALKISKVNETTLTLAGVVTYGIGRLTGSRTVADVALHSTEAVLLGSIASQLIRGPLGRSRPYVTKDSNQYDFKPFGGFLADTAFNYRAFPSIHTSSSMAVATVLAMETHRRRPGATPYVAPLLFVAGIIPGLARVHLDQHWASDIAAGAFMGAMAGYKVVSYSHAHPNNRFDRFLLRASIVPDASGRMMLVVNPSW